MNRAQYTSIFADEDYKSALQYADNYQKEIYEQEATVIDEIQKGILTISQKEEPFDVFICYKETDKNGQRTKDSVLATDLYYQLVQEGFKVFFSRITLEDKLGVAYEPYIFSALNSAKVMIVLGTKPEYFNAVWVKNEWSRYLALIKHSNGKKNLIPAYRDMDPYDLPEEFSHLQAQDMSKIGFVQDVIRGIIKIVPSKADKLFVTKESMITVSNTNISPLLKRAFIFLEDENWKAADAYCEKVLDIDPECAEAYLGKLMVELHVKKQEELVDCNQPFENRNNYQKAIRFANDKLAATLKKYLVSYNERREKARLEGIYSNARSSMERARTELEFKNLASIFESITEYKDSEELCKVCQRKAEDSHKDEIYFSAKEKMRWDKIASYEQAIYAFQAISGWKDSIEQISNCQKAIEQLKIKEENDRLKAEQKAEQRKIVVEKQKKIAKYIVALIIVICIAIASVVQYLW